MNVNCTLTTRKETITVTSVTKTFLPLLLTMLLMIGWNAGFAQTPNGYLDFGNPTNGTTATTGNTGFGGVRIGTGGGSFTIQNPGQSIGTTGELRGIAPTGGSINSVGVTSTEFGSSASTFTVSFELHLSGGASGNWYFFAGNSATQFGTAQSSTFSDATTFTGIQWVFGSSNTITTNNRGGSSWTAISGTPFAQGVAYYVTIVGNNSSSSVNYGSSNAYSVASGKYDLWINGTLAGDDLGKATLAANTAINGFRFYGESSTGNVAQIALDNIRWYNTCVLPPTHLTLVSVPSTGTVGANLSSFTAEARSGSTTGPVANSFTGAITVAKVSGSGAILGTTAPNAVAGVATYSNIQFDAASTYTINASAAPPIVNAATSGNIVVSASSGTAPTLNAAGSATVDADFNITFTDDATWRASVTSVKYGSNTLTLNTDYTLTNGILTLKPSGSVASGLRTAGTQTVTVTATGYPDATVSQTIGVGAFNKMQLLVPGETAAPGTATGKTGTPSATTAGAGFTVTVNAVDQYWNVVTTAPANTIAITTSDANDTHPSTNTLSSGTRTFTVTFTTAGSWTVTATNSSDGTKTANTSPSITTNSGAFSKMQILVPGETAAPGTATGKTGTPSAQTAGTGFTVTVNAVDANWNVVSSAPTNTIAISTTDANDTHPSNANLASGTRNFTVTFTTAGSWTVTATNNSDGAKTANTSPSITVNAGAFSKMQILVPGETAAPGTASGKTGTPSTQAAGTGFTVTVNAVDANWNVVSGAPTNTIAITTSDANDTHPASANLSSGTASFAVTFTTAGSWTVTATNSTDGAKTANTSPSITTTAGAFSKLQILVPGETAAPGTTTGKTGTPTTQTAANAFSVTVNAVDANWNVITTAPADNVGITSTDGAAGLPANNTLSSGTRSFSVTLNTAGSATVTATNLTDGTKTASTSASITVNPAYFYRSFQTGNWASASTWEQSADGNAPWTAAVTSPTSTIAQNITILSGHTVTVAASVTADQLTINNGGQITVSSGQTFTIANGTGTDLTVTGTLQNNGIVALQGATATTVSASTGIFNNAGSLTLATVTTALTINGTFNQNTGGTITNSSSGPITVNGTYNHALNGGVIPTATWATSSNCNITGMTSTAPTGYGQQFGNFTWNSTAQTTFAVIGAAGSFNPKGLMTVTSTGTSVIELESAGSGSTYNFEGGLTIEGGTFIVNYDNSGTTLEATLNITGTLDIKGTGLFDAAQGGGNAAASGYSATINLTGDLKINSSTSYPFTTTATNNYSRINFTGSTTQNYYRTSTTGSRYVDYFIPATKTLVLQNNLLLYSPGNDAIDVSGTLITGTNTISQSSGTAATFTINSGGTLITSNSGGINSTITVGGAKTYTAGANYIFNGATTTAFPTTGQQASFGNPANITVNAAVSLNRSLSMSGTLSLNGILTTTSSALLTITNTSNTAITGASSTAFISGPVAWTLPANLATGTSYVFPVGKTNYLPFTLNPVTGAAGPVINVEAFETTTGGTAGAGLASLSANEYWLASVSSGNFTSGIVSLTRQSALGVLNRIGYNSSTLAGTYTSLGGTVSGTSIINSNSTNSLGYFVMAEITNASTSSDIIRSGSFTEPTNITYGSYQSSNITTSGAGTGNIKIAEFTIRDGGASADADNLGTILNAITFNISNSGNIRRIAIVDGSTVVSEVAGGATAAFTGLSLTTTDGGTKTFSIYASFNTSVTDNQQIQLTVASATASSSGSLFAAANAGGASSDIAAANANKIVVTASKLTFTTEPASTIGVNGTFVTPPAVTAQDANNNKDADYTFPGSAISATNGITMTNANGTVAAGVFTFNTNFSFTTTGTTVLSVTDNNYTATSGVTITINTVTNPNDFFRSKVTGLWSATSTWESSPNGSSGWMDATMIPNNSGARVTISNGTTVTLDQSASVGTLTVGGGTSGVLQYQNTTTVRTLTVTGNMTVAAGGQFTIGTQGASVTHQLALAGNLSIGNGATLDLHNSTNQRVNITFNSTSDNDQTITAVSGTPTTVEFGGITLNRNSATRKVVNNLTCSAPSYSGDQFTYSTAGVFEQAAGTFTIAGSSNQNVTASGTLSVTGSGSMTFPASLFTAGTFVMNTSGTVSVGSPTGGGNRLDPNGGTVILTSGTMNIYSRIGTATAPGMNNWTGTLTINGATVNVNVPTTWQSGTIGLFGVPASGASFTMSSGVLNIQEAQQSTSYTGNDIDIQAGSITGGTIVLGNATDPGSQAYLINLGVAVSGLTFITGSNAITVASGNNITVNGDLTLTSGVITLAASTTLTLNGGVARTSGKITSASTNSLVFGANSGSLTLPNDLFSSAPTLTGLTINRAGGVTLGNQNITTSTLTLTNGILTTGSNTISCTNTTTPISGGSSSSYVNGRLNITYPSSGTNISRTFPVGKGGNYRPLIFTYASPGSRTVTIEQFEAAFPVALPATISAGSFGNRYWTITQSSTGSAYSVSLNNGGASPSGLVVIVRNEGGGASSSNSTTFSTPNYTNSSAFATGNVSSNVALCEILIPITDADFRSAGNVNFTTGTNWEYDLGGNNWQPASQAPGSGNNVSILGTDIATMNTNFTVGGSKTLTMASGSSLVIEPGITFNISNTTANAVQLNGASVTLRSSAAGTASVGALNSTGSNLAGATNVTVERYIPARRAWRGLSVPLSSATAGNSIFNNWQNNGIVTEGEGVLLWNGTGTGGYSQNTTSGSNTNLRSYTGGTGYAIPPTTTGANLISGGKPVPYLVFVTDYYKTGTNTGNMTSGATATILKAKGTLYKGDYQTGTLASGYHMIPNPYPSPITLTAGILSTVSDKFWVWDPKLISNGGYGGYVTTTGGISGPVGGNGSYTTETRVVPSGGAFWVKSTGSSSVTLTESSKNGSDFNIYGRYNNGSTELIRVNLLNDNGDLYDGIAVAYQNDGNAAIDDKDAAKFAMLSENISVKRSGVDLAIEFRPLVDSSDTIFLNLYQLQKKEYVLQVSGQGFDVAANLTAVLQDLYLNKETVLNIYGVQTYKFTVDNNAASSNERFRIVFRPSAVTPVTDLVSLKTVKLYPNPVSKGTEVQLQFRNSSAGKYEVTLYNLVGVQVMKQTVSHGGGNGVQKLDLPQALAAGTYIAEITDAKGNKGKVKLVIE